MKVRGTTQPTGPPLPARSRIAGVPGGAGGVGQRSFTTVGPGGLGAGAAFGHGADLILGSVVPRARPRWWRRLGRLSQLGPRQDGAALATSAKYSGRYVALVEAVAVGSAAAVVAVAADRHPTPSLNQLATFAAFVVLAVAALFAFRAGGSSGVLGRPAEHPYREALSPWTLPVALLLPPTYAAVMHLPLVLASWFRLRPRRRIFFDAAALTVAGMAAAFIHRALTPTHGAYQIESLVGSAGRVVALFVAVAVFAATSRALHAVLCWTLGQQTEYRRLLGGREAVVVDTTETCSAIVVAVLWTAHPLLLFATTPPALLLQRNLHHTELLYAARTDTKTGLANPAYWRGVAEGELLRTRRAGRPTSVLLVDVDHFKLVNDNHGHLVGDAVLACVADALRAATRPRELVGRFGGEEFVVLLADTDTDTAVDVAERIRCQVAAARCRAAGRPAIAVTVSVGVACASPVAAGGNGPGNGPGSSGVGEPLDSLLERADGALYAAKTAGRDCVRAAIGSPALAPAGEVTTSEEQPPA